MLRTLAATVLALAAATSPVLAGDAAELNILGFSQDGAIFAFEEYGVQDGSGFPYANRFYIDTQTDSFVEGSPVRVRLDDEAASLAEAREAARRQGEAIVAEAVLLAHPGFTAGRNAVTEFSADPHRMRVNPRPVFPPIDEPIELLLEEFEAPSSQSCPDFGPTKGFRLIQVATSPSQSAVLVHEDSAIPPSRRCPLGYAIGAVQTFHPANGDRVVMALIAVRSVGFEGPDHRWIALPVHD